MPKAIGLDFGTTNSALAIANPDRSVTLAEFSASSTFRSILYFDEDESRSPSKLRVTAGPDAIQSYLNARAPGRLIQSTKSYLASRLFGKTQILNETFIKPSNRQRSKLSWCWSIMISVITYIDRSNQ